MDLNKFWKNLKEYNKIASIEEIGRRYFAMNSFDGILTILGVLIGSYIAKVQDPHIIITTGLGVSIAMGISGMWGTYLTEEAERSKKMKDLARHTLRDMGKTKIAKAEKAATLIVSFIDGISPFLAAFIVILPFFFTTIIGITSAFYASVGIAFILLAALGGFLGYISKDSIFLYSIKMVFAGIVCIGLIFLLG